MAAGDDATNAGYTVYPDSVLANRIAELIAYVQDDLANKTGDKGTPIPLAKGGTGATDAEAARAALGLIIATSITGSEGKVPTYGAGGTLAADTPTANIHVANKGYVDAAVGGSSGKVSKTGDTMTGDLTITGSGNHLYVPSSVAATSGYTVAYINVDGRLSRGASSERYKHDIRDAEDLGDTFAAPLREFKMNDGDGSYRVGYIAEELEQAGLDRYVVYADHGDGPVPDSIDFIAFLSAQIAQLRQYNIALHDRITQLEAGNE